jgi:hypothetical protein
MRRISMNGPQDPILVNCRAMPVQEAVLEPFPAVMLQVSWTCRIVPTSIDKDPVEGGRVTLALPCESH